MNAKRIKRVALYVRVSTDHQTIKNQDRELRAVADRHGWEIVATFKDEGISGAKGRDERPGSTSCCRRLPGKNSTWLQHGRSIVSADRCSTWCRCCRNYTAKHVDLYLHQQGIDTTTPSGKAMFQMMGVFAEFERSMIHERVMAGLARAKAEGKRSGRRPTVTNDIAKVRAIQSDHKAGKSLREIAKAHGVGHMTVARLTTGVTS